MQLFTPREFLLLHPRAYLKKNLPKVVVEQELGAVEVDKSKLLKTNVRKWLGLLKVVWERSLILIKVEVEKRVKQKTKRIISCGGKVGSRSGLNRNPGTDRSATSSGSVFSSPRVPCW